MTNTSDTPDPPPAPATPATSPTPPIPAAPPTIPGQIGSVERRPVWPIPIGIIVIVFSAWTLLSGLIAVVEGFIGVPIMDFWFSPRNPGVSDTITQIYTNMAPGFLVSGAFLLIAAAFGLTGGIALLCRKRWSVVNLRLWAVVKILSGAVYAVTEAMVQTQLMLAGTQLTGGGVTPADVARWAFFDGAISFIFGAALPMFVLVWFSRPRIRADCGKW